MSEPEVKESRKPDEVLREIETTLATLDGVATSDAFRLGGLVREYGMACAGESASAIIGPLLDAMLKPKGEKDEPWKEGR